MKTHLRWPGKSSLRLISILLFGCSVLNGCATAPPDYSTDYPPHEIIGTWRVHFELFNNTTVQASLFRDGRVLLWEGPEEDMTEGTYSRGVITLPDADEQLETLRVRMTDTGELVLIVSDDDSNLALVLTRLSDEPVENWYPE